MSDIGSMTRRATLGGAALGVGAALTSVIVPVGKAADSPELTCASGFEASSLLPNRLREMLGIAKSI